MKQKKINWKAFGPKIPKGTKNWLINILIALGTVILVFLIMGLIVKPILESFGLTNPAGVADRFAFFMGKPLVFIGLISYPLYLYHQPVISFLKFYNILYF